MTEMKPCPFHKEKVIPYLETGYDEGNGHPESGGYWASIECPYCNVEMTTLEHSIEEQAIEAVTKDWNTRFEPTCKKLSCELNIGDKYIEYRLKCSECEHLLEEDDNYCPNCGRKAVNGCTIDRVYLYDEEAVEGIECSKCGWSEIRDHDDPLPEICPNCKARVMEE